MKFILLIAIATALFMYYRHNKRKQQRIINMNYVKERYGNDIWLLVDSKQLYVGMPKELVTIGWGKPKRVINHPTSECWVYDRFGSIVSNQIFFVNGVVDMWTIHN